MEGVADTKIHALPPTCYHVKSGSSATKSVRINRKEPQNWGSAGTPPLWGGSVDDHLKKASSPYVLPCTSNLVVNSQSYIRWRSKFCRSAHFGEAEFLSADFQSAITFRLTWPNSAAVECNTNTQKLTSRRNEQLPSCSLNLLPLHRLLN